MQKLGTSAAMILAVLLVAIGGLGAPAHADSRDVMAERALRRPRPVRPRAPLPPRRLPRQIDEVTATPSETTTATPTDTPTATPSGIAATATLTRTPTATPTAGFCGDGLIGGSEECESDADCGLDPPCFVCRCTHGPFAGPVRITLRWSNHNDVDLAVIDPAGEVLLPFVDANARCLRTTRKPEENVFIPRALVGCYTIIAHHQQRCPASGIVDTHLDIRTNVEGVKGTVHDVPGPEPGEGFVTVLGVRADCGE